MTPKDTNDNPPALQTRDMVPISDEKPVVAGQIVASESPLGTLVEDAGLDHAHVYNTLRARLPVDIIEIKPTGETYLPQAHYRRLLCEVFGVGGWGMEPHREYAMPKVNDQGTQVKLTWPMWLVIRGRRIALGIGEASYFKTSGRSSLATAAESAKSDALVRACKDVGIANELWDPVFSRWFQDNYCVKVYVDKGQNRRDIQWRRKDRPRLEGELGPVPEQGRPQVYPEPQSTDDPFEPAATDEPEVPRSSVPIGGRDPGEDDDYAGSNDPRERYETVARPSEDLRGCISQEQIVQLMIKWKETGLPEQALKDALAERYEITSRKEIRRIWFPAILDWISRLEPKPRGSHARIRRGR